MVTMNGDETGTILMSSGVNSTLDHAINAVMEEDGDDGISDDSDGYEDGSDLMTVTMEDEVTAQLAASGPIGVAAAAAIASAKKRKRPHQFETNPSIRKRQQTRLIRKLRQTIDEFTIRVGMQAVVLVAVPGKPQNSFKCFGAKPLEDVIRNLRPVVMQDLESALAHHTPAPPPDDPSLHEMPALVIDGIPTPVEKMTQAQLRAFIPLMLKYSTGRGKPGWGKESTRPHWWPQDLPWANVRMDARSDVEKQKVSWTHALRQIVINCYKYHGREDLLPVFNGDHEEVDIKPPISKMAKASPDSHITNTNSSNSPSNLNLNIHSQSQNQSITTQALTLSQYGSSVLQTITNPDGTVSIIQVDGGSPSIITLPDGSTAHVQGIGHIQSLTDGQISEVQHQDGSEGMSMVDLNSVATISQEGQIILTAEDGNTYPVTVSGMLGVHHNMYQTVVANISQISGQNSDGTLQRVISTGRKKMQQRIIRVNREQPIVAAQETSSYIYVDQRGAVVTPMVMPKLEPGTEPETTSIPLSALTGDPAQTQLISVNAQGQVIHNDKVYQLCEFLKPDGNGTDKVIMMAQVDTIRTDLNDVSGEIQVVEAQSIQMGEEEMPTEEMEEEEEAQEHEPTAEESVEIQISEDLSADTSETTATTVTS